MRVETCFLFDLDGTLVDSVHQHVLAWSQALDEEGIALSVWRIHRKIGMSGGLFTNQLPRETCQDISEDRIARLGRLHAEAYGRLSSQIRPLPGAQALLANLTVRLGFSGRLREGGSHARHQAAGRQERRSWLPCLDRGGARAVRGQAEARHPSAPCLRPPALHRPPARRRRALGTAPCAHGRIHDPHRKDRHAGDRTHPAAAGRFDRRSADRRIDFHCHRAGDALHQGKLWDMVREGLP
ncbi:hypothetical protein MHIMP23_07125 [Methylobacterium hispanicum]